VEGLVPVLALGHGAQDPVADAGQWRSDHQRADRPGRLAGDRLGDPAADVIPGDHRGFQAQLIHEAENAPRLRLRGVGAAGVLRVLVGLTESAP
jgi:hypothetical protein